MTSNLGILQVEPGEIALVVVVGEQRIGAQAEEIGEGGVGAEGGGIAQMPAPWVEERLVFLVIRDARSGGQPWRLTTV